MQFRIIPYSITSESAALVATKMTELAGYKVEAGAPSYDHRNLLWGSSAIQMQTLQPTAAINIAKSKLATFNALKSANVSIPDFSTLKQEAEEWVRAGTTVFVRKKLNASSGRGIVVSSKLPLEDAPLYVKSVSKTKEFRVHVVADQVIDLQEKRRKNGSKVNEMIRNLDNGWVFCRQNIIVPTGLKELGIAAVKAIGLLFGAVDVIFDAAANKLYVLEVNTAPGLTNSTAINYAKAFLSLPS